MKKSLHNYLIIIAGSSVLLILSATQLLMAQWSIDPMVNYPVAVSLGKQDEPQIMSDGTGGAFITWVDEDMNYVIDVERINKSGDKLWSVQLASGGLHPALTSDGKGGAIVTWQVNTDIYAQRINAAGQIQWTANGVAICLANDYQFLPQIIMDGFGGAIITWLDGRNSSTTNNDIYVQRINASGQVQWATDGVAICVAAGYQNSVSIVSDGQGGAYITWQDPRNQSTSGTDVYAQRINQFGQVQWTTDGIAVCNAANDQYNPKLTNDGSGNVIITWNDNRNNTYDIYAQKLDPLSNVLWPSNNGIAICTAANDQYNPVITNDGAGGAIIAWDDYRSGNGDIYAQRINRNGSVQWATDGIAVSTRSDNEDNPVIISDGNSGAIISWEKKQSYYDIYSQKINASGQTQWDQNGRVVSNAKNDQRYPVITSDGNGGALITWTDSRNSTIDQLNYDVYAQKIDRFGYLGDANPVLTRVQDVPGDQGGKVTVSWDASPYDISSQQLITSYSVWRGIDTNVINPVLLKKFSRSGFSKSFVQSADGKKYLIRTVNGTETTWEWLADLPSHYLKHYSYTAATTSDSTSQGIPYFKYFVSAQGFK